MMAPTVVMRGGEVELVLGSAGSNRIRSAILQTIVAVVDHGAGAQEAVDAPRVHLEDGVLFAEPGIDLSSRPGPARGPVQRPQPLLRRRAGGAPARRASSSGGGDPRRGGVAVTRVRGALALLAPPRSCWHLRAARGSSPATCSCSTRTDPSTHSTLTMLVNEEGGLRCNGGRELKISDPALVEARGAAGRTP